MMLDNIKVVTSSNGPLSADQWAALATDKIIHVGNQTEGPIREQALAYKQSIKTIIAYYIGQAIADNEKYLLSRR
jgi:hypothetical protein